MGRIYVPWVALLLGLGCQHAAPSSPQPRAPATAAPRPEAPPPARRSGVVATGRPLTSAAALPIVSALRSAHRIDVEVHGGVTDARGATAFVLYSYSELDACVRELADAAKGRRRCRARHYDEDLEGIPGCRETWLARARLVGGGNERRAVLEQQLQVHGGCKVADVPIFSLCDVDDDRNSELHVDAVFTRPYREAMGEPVEVFHTRSPFVGVYRLDLTPQVAMSLGEIGFEYFTLTHETAGRYVLEDDDEDGHRDLVVETIEYTTSNGDCLFDGLWPRLDSDHQDEPCSGVVVRRAYTYDARTDTYAGAPVQRGPG